MHPTTKMGVSEGRRSRNNTDGDDTDAVAGNGSSTTGGRPSSEQPSRSDSSSPAASSGHRDTTRNSAANEEERTVSIAAGKTVWTDVAGAGAKDDSSVHSAHSTTSLGSRHGARNHGVGGGGSRAASMLARTRNAADEYAAGRRLSGSFTSAVSAGNSAGRASRRTSRTQSFDSSTGNEADASDSILRQLVMERSSNAAAGRGATPSEAIPEGSNEFSSQSLNVSMSLAHARGGISIRNRKADYDGATDDNGGSSNSMDEVERATLSLWGIAAKNTVTSSSHGAAADEDACGATVAKSSSSQGTGAKPSSSQGNAQDRQGISEVPESTCYEPEDTTYIASRFSLPPPPQPKPQHQSHDNSPINVMLQRVRSIGKAVHEQGQQLFERTSKRYASDAHEGQVPRRNESVRDDNDDDSSHLKNHEASFFAEAGANATSYMSDVLSLLFVLLSAPFYWLYFTVTGRDYHDRYGSPPDEEDGATASPSAFGSTSKSTTAMSQEELYERSEVYLDAKEEDGTFFALLAFHHPGLVPLVDETVDAVQLAQELGEDTAKTGDTDFAAALDPDKCVHLFDDGNDDDINADDDRSRVSFDSHDIEDAVSARSGRSRNRGRSIARSRSRSVDARIRRRDKSEDEWVYDINTQKMRLKRGIRRNRSNKLSSGSGSQKSIGGRTNDTASMSIDDTHSGRSEDPAAPTSSSSSKPLEVFTSSLSGRGRRRRKSKSDRSYASGDETSGLIREPSAKWKDRGRTTENDRAAWKLNQSGLDSADDIVAASIAELERIGSAASPYKAGHEKERPRGRRGLGMSSFRRVQEGLRKSTRRIQVKDTDQYGHEVPKDVPDIV